MVHDLDLFNYTASSLRFKRVTHFSPCFNFKSFSHLNWLEILILSRRKRRRNVFNSLVYRTRNCCLRCKCLEEHWVLSCSACLWEWDYNHMSLQDLILDPPGSFWRERKFPRAVWKKGNSCFLVIIWLKRIFMRAINC